MKRTVIMLDGPIGVGKTTLGRVAAMNLAFGFIDGDDHASPGHWLRSILKTSHNIVAACEFALQSQQGVLVSYPLRCTNWVFYRQTFGRMDITFHCIGLIAAPEAILTRERELSAGEVARSFEMIAQGYGQREFSAAQLRTDEAPFEETALRLEDTIRRLLRSKRASV